MPLAGTRHKRVYDRNRSPERDGPDLTQAATMTPTRVRVQFSLYNFEAQRFEIWRGAGHKVIAATADEAADLFEHVKKAMDDWWSRQHAGT